MFRVGNGYDVHRLDIGTELIIGGVHIPYEKGLVGHSDADVLTHAIMDSLLGALAHGDIGNIFPDSDEYKDANSIALLKKIIEIVKRKKYRVGNIDAVIIAQSPKLAPYIAEMKIIIAEALSIAPTQVSIKATTEEGLGFTGSGEGMAAHAVCLLFKKE